MWHTASTMLIYACASFCQAYDMLSQSIDVIPLTRKPLSVHAQWLNSTLRQMWPFYDAAVCATVKVPMTASVATLLL